MKEYRFLIDTDGEITIIDDEGGYAYHGDEGVQFIKQYLVIEEIREKIMSDDYVKENEEIKGNIGYILKNYYIDRMQLLDQMHNMLLRLAVAETRDQLEEEYEM